MIESESRGVSAKPQRVKRTDQGDADLVAELRTFVLLEFFGGVCKVVFSRFSVSPSPTDAS